jgi:hypothetical protein
MTNEQFHQIRSEYARILGRAPDVVLLAVGFWSPAEVIVALREIPDRAGQTAIDAAMEPTTMKQTVRRLWLEVFNEESDTPETHS